VTTKTRAPVVEERPVSPRPVVSGLSRLRERLAQANEEARRAERRYDEAEYAASRIKRLVDAEESRLAEEARVAEDAEPEVPLRVVLPEHVKAGWSVDISANALAQLEREAAAKLPKEGL
jgi:hypothetical protein